MNCKPDYISETAFAVRGIVVADTLTVGNPADDGCIHLPFKSLTRERLDEFNFGEVYTPALADGFDCTDVARVLADAEFTGRLLIMNGGFPDPCLILREVRSSFPSLSVELADAA